MKKGTLYAIGTGPGAEDLITLRAANILGRVSVILAAASSKNDSSAAFAIVKNHVAKGARVLRLDFPMTYDRAALAQAWGNAARTSLEVLANGEDAAFLCLGDPLIYSTFIYLMAAIKKIAPDTRIEIVPGITSFQAAAARAQMPLCEGSSNFQLLSGIASESELERQLANDSTSVILKVYRNYPAIREALKKTGRLKNCVLASFVEQNAGKIEKNPGVSGHPPYMSLIISPGGKSR